MRLILPVCGLVVGLHSITKSWLLALVAFGSLLTLAACLWVLGIWLDQWFFSRVLKDWGPPEEDGWQIMRRRKGGK